MKGLGWLVFCAILGSLEAQVAYTDDNSTEWSSSLGPNTDAPEANEAQLLPEDSVVTEYTAFSESTVITDNPVVTGKWQDPVVTEEYQEPAVTENSEEQLVTRVPIITYAQVVTKATTEATLPVFTEAPTEEAIPVVTEAPTEATIRVVTNEQTQATVPVFTKVPTIATVPVTKEPVVTKTPLVEKIQVVTNKPVILKAKVVTEAPENHQDAPVNASAQIQELVDGYKTFMGEMMKKGMEVMLPIVTEADLSTECLTSMLQLVNGIRNLDDWAISMFDATAKIPVGVLDGTNMQLGEYDECLNIEHFKEMSGRKVSSFKGQYCTVQLQAPEIFYQIPPEHRRELHQQSIIPQLRKAGGVFEHMLKLHYGFNFMFIRLGLCLPSTCSKEDLQSLMTIAVQDLKFRVTIPNCEVKDDLPLPINIYQIIIMAVLVIFVLLSAICTLIEAFAKQRSEKCTETIGWYIIRQGVEVFSIKNNFQRLMETTPTVNGALPFLCGLRVITMTVIISGFSFSLPYLPFLHKIARKINHLKMRENFIHGLFGSASIPIDTLIFMSGLLAAYQYGMRNPKVNNLRKSLRFLLPILAKCLGGMFLAIGLFMLLPLIGDGPDWTELVGHNVQVCKDNWWRNMLFIQNLWPFSDNCLFNTYLLSILVQCSILAVFLLWILFKNPKIGVAFQLFFIFVSAAASGTLNAVERYPPTLALAVINGHTMFEVMSYDLIKPYNHVSIYCIGMLIGWLLHQEFSWTKTTKGLTWFAYACSFAIVFYVPFNFPYTGDVYRSLSALYAASFRTIWGVGCGAFVLLCAKGGAGLLNKLVSWKVFIVLDKLSYLAYLIHPIIIMYYHGQSRIHFFLGYPEILIHSVGFTVITFGSCMFLYLFLTSPIERLSVLIGDRHTRVASISPQQQYMTTEDMTQTGAKSIKVLA